MELFTDLANLVTSIGWVPFLCFALGLVLVMIEIFAPGFGFPGISGTILLLIGVVLTAKTLLQAFVMVIIILIILGIALAAVFRSAAKGRLSRTLILSDSMKKESGYISTTDLESFMNKEGYTITNLRPAGAADFDGIKLDVVSESSFIAKGTKVKIIMVSGPRIVVREIE
ncbi:NfeD family protein [Petroclostridium sp. X23]|jgi:membrane-bound ClpP family serine protease|uniref:NfeD family protein n=1 Tax=Petroclostridium sp. X23 TaxID=3045146 RepID=UPI0024AD3709|nr:NfeD family protein [Petroclostridium sp. X23]WHH61001.1 NfeD family protein [Petroclostridium sp. X23]